jgi:acetylglutamate kinase
MPSHTQPAYSAPVVVLKVSGTLIGNGAALAPVWDAVTQLRSEGTRVVLVHGGGQQMTALAERLGHTPTVVEGRRVTTDLDLDIVQWALCGKVNTQLVAQATKRGLDAIGCSGADGGLVRVAKRPPWTIDGRSVDFGWVGDIERVDPSVLTALLEAGLLPVVAPLGLDDDGQAYNVNADTVAQAVAGALGADRLLFVTRAGAVRRDADAPASRLDTCDPATLADGVDGGWLRGGMRVKVEAALDALRAGVGEAFICGPDDLLARKHATQIVLDSVPATADAPDP